MAYVRLQSDIRYAASLPSAPTVITPSVNLQTTSTLSRWESACEAAVHATRRYTDAMLDGHVVAKIDFSNAFNSLRRDLMLLSVASTVPGIYRFYHLAYSQPSVLRFETRTILCLRKVRTKVIHWAHFCSVSLFTLTYNACSQSLWPVLWTI